MKKGRRTRDEKIRYPLLAVPSLVADLVADHSNPCSTPNPQSRIEHQGFCCSSWKSKYKTFFIRIADLLDCHHWTTNLGVLAEHYTPPKILHVRGKGGLLFWANFGTLSKPYHPQCRGPHSKPQRRWMRHWPRSLQLIWKVTTYDLLTSRYSNDHCLISVSPNIYDRTAQKPYCLCERNVLSCSQNFPILTRKRRLHFL